MCSPWAGRGAGASCAGMGLRALSVLLSQWVSAEEGQLLPVIPWGALDACPHPLGLEGPVCAVCSELGRGGGTGACPRAELWG